MESDKVSKVTRVFGVFGLLVPIVVFSLVLVAVSQYSGFSWANNMLSDLGDPSVSSATLFNSGLIAGGVLMMVFAVGLLIALKRALSRVGAILLLVDAVFLSLIGVFTLASNIHYPVSVTFFVLFPISLWLIGAGAILAGSKVFGVLTIIWGVLSGIPWVLIIYFVGWAIPEAVSAVVAFAWVAVEGIMLLLGRTKG